jgi:V8-like Glu-specific endopeptidase
MGRRAAFAAACTAGALALSGAALGVLGGSADNGAHPYVGFIEQFNSAGGRELCSGFLVSSTVMVTSAHCFLPGPDNPVKVSFADDATAQSAFTATGTVTNDPQFCLGCGNGLPGGDTHDIAVVILDQPQSPGRFAVLPSAPAPPVSVNTSIDVVGYGVTDGKAQTGFGTRRIAATKVNGNGAISAEFLKLQGSPGACFGDSGGPDLIHGTDNAVALVTFTGGNPQCNGVTYSLRLDTPDSLAFVESFLTPG